MVHNRVIVVYVLVCDRTKGVVEMATIEKIDRTAATQIAKAVEAAMKKVAEEFGLEYERKGGKFDPEFGTFAPKGEFKLANSEQKTFEACVKNWAWLETRQWIKPEHYGLEFKSNGKTFKLIAMNLRAPKYLFEAKCLDNGKVFRFTEAGIRQVIEKKGL